MKGASEAVRKCWDAGWTRVGDFAALSFFSVGHRGGSYQLIHMRAGNRLVEVCISPTGRSIRVYVDGNEVLEQ